MIFNHKSINIRCGLWSSASDVVCRHLLLRLDCHFAVLLLLVVPDHFTLDCLWRELDFVLHLLQQQRRLQSDGFQRHRIEILVRYLFQVRKPKKTFGWLFIPEALDKFWPSFELMIIAIINLQRWSDEDHWLDWRRSRISRLEVISMSTTSLDYYLRNSHERGNFIFIRTS